MARKPRKARRVGLILLPDLVSPLPVVVTLAVLAIFNPAARAQASVPGADLHAVGEPAAASDTVEAQSANVQTIFRLTNDDRATQGLAALAWSATLAAAAQAHAQLMAGANAGELSHRYPGEPDLTKRASDAGAHFSSIAENIAQGGNARQIEKQWMTSVPHRTNILDPRMNSIGVAVFASGGTLYAVEDFAAAQSMITPNAAEQEVEAALQTIAPAPPGLVTRAREPARQYCLHGEQPSPGNETGARFQLQWESSSLALPQPLVQAVRSGRYRAAAVGACPPVGQANQGFATYHVAVLLY